jgi:hypothetical protein
MPKAIHAPQVQFMALANSRPQGNSLHAHFMSIQSAKLILYKKFNELTASRHELMLHIMISRRHSASSMI